MKKQEFQTVEYTVPEWILSYMVNGDATGITDEEQETAEKFFCQVFDEFGAGHWSVDLDQTPNEFSYNDVDHFIDTTYEAVYVYGLKPSQT